MTTLPIVLASANMTTKNSAYDSPYPLYLATTMNINEPFQGKAFNLPFTKSNRAATEVGQHGFHLPFGHILPDNVRNHVIAMSGEFTGTVLFLFFALSGAQVANNIPSTTVNGTTQAATQAGSNPAQLQYIALCFGFSLAVNAWVFFRIR